MTGQRSPVDPTRELWIGLDTGGTYTDSVALDARRRVVASAKALTTHWDLSVGLGASLRALLAALPAGLTRHEVTLVSVSTTLATNAVVENRFSPICALLVGFDDAMVARSGLRSAGTGAIVQVRGGHDPTGVEAEALDEAAVMAAVREHAPQVAAFAVAAQFSVRNPQHERRVRELIRGACELPVTCSHELSSRLDAPLRALTAALNARLTPQISHLLEALRRVLAQESIAAPLMVVKGDGTLMRAEVALECPVETVLSGPAASVVGAGFLSGLSDFAVADMGGTTTDVALVRNGLPAVAAEGAVVGGWRTMVEAVDVRTCGLGGDSEVHFDRERRLRVGPRRAMPLALLAHESPGVLEDLRVLAAGSRVPHYAPRYALRNPGCEEPGRLDSLEQRVWQALTPQPRRAGDVVRSAQGMEALHRLVDRGLATLATFTPSDAMHVLGSQRGWNDEAARLGATILAIEERNASAYRLAPTPEELSGRVCEHVVREAGRLVLESAMAQDPGVEAPRGRWGPLGRLLEDTVAGRRFSSLVDARMHLGTTLVAIGAPAAAYYPEVARRLGATLVVPEYAAVCNAVGAVAGVVSQTCDVIVNQPALDLFRVHDPAGSRDYASADEALADARRVAQQLALEAARSAGAVDAHVEVSVTERRARVGPRDDYLAEATVRARATGRPSAGRAVQQ
ncbi:MAG: hydantoinase/oxoprolinase family protein [Proteobacteria bacterium]|nr:hydantoinase/oxoprolinase family protein [Pseudomonadota bacterium]